MIKLNQVGEFPATITSATFIESSKGNPGLQLIAEVSEGPCAGQSAPIDLWLDDQNVSAKDSQTCFQRTMLKLVEVFNFAGTDVDQLVGKPCSIVTHEEEFTKSNGSKGKSIKVQYLNRAGGTAAKQLAASKVNSLAAKMAKQAAVIAKATGQKPAAPAATAATRSPAPAPIAGDGPPEGDDVPF